MDIRVVSKQARTLVLSAVAAAWLLPASTSALSAQPAACMLHKDLIGYLNARFDEVPRALGLVASRSMMQVFVSQKNGTWTIVMTTVEGLSCIVAAGDAWEDVKLKVAEGPEY